MRTYSANGCGHQILAKLAVEPAYFETLRTIGRTLKDLQFTLVALSQDHLIELTRRGYEITEAGSALLDQLNEGRDTAGPSVKVYGARAPA